MFLHSTNCRQRNSVEIVFVPPPQNSAALFLLGFLEHVVCFVVDFLPHSWSMSGSMGRIFFYDVTGD